MMTLLPLHGRHREEQEPETHLEPGDAGIVGVGIAAGPEDDDHDDADGHEAADPPEGEGGPGRPRPGRPEDEDDGHDRNRTESDGERRRQQVSDDIAQHGRRSLSADAADPAPRHDVSRQGERSAAGQLTCALPWLQGFALSSAQPEAKTKMRTAAGTTTKMTRPMF
jgi:hypothetical protein